MWSIIHVVADPQDLCVRAGFLQGSLSSLEPIQQRFELVIVNNARPEDCPTTTQYLRDYAQSHPHAKLVESGSNLGTSGGFNGGFKAIASESRFVVLMSTDGFITDPNILSKYEQVFEDHADVGIIHPLSLFEDVESYNVSLAYGVREYYRRLTLLKSKRVAIEGLLPKAAEISTLAKKINARPLSLRGPQSSIPLTFTAVRRELYEQLAGFDEGFFVNHENEDFTIRALLRGMKTVALENSLIDHRRLHLRGYRVLDAKPYDPGPHYDRTEAHWQRKWGRPAEDIVGEIRLGRSLYARVRPLFDLKRKMRGLADRTRSILHL